MRSVQIVLVLSLAFAFCTENQNRNNEIPFRRDRNRRALVNPEGPPVRQKSAYGVNPPESESASEGAYPVRHKTAYAVNLPEPKSASEGAYPVRHKTAYLVNPPEPKSASEGPYPVRHKTAYAVNPPESESASEGAYPVRHKTAYPVNPPEPKSASEEAYRVPHKTAYAVNPPVYDPEPQGAYGVYPVEEAYRVPHKTAYAVNPPEYDSEPEGAYGVYPVESQPPPKRGYSVRQKTAYGENPPEYEPEASQDKIKPKSNPSVSSAQPLANVGPKKTEQFIPTVSFKKDYSIYNLDNTLPVLETYNGETCEISLTRVQNEKICKGQLLFYDDFDSLSPKKWSNDIRIPNQPDYEFVTYIQNKNNCYIDKGALVIKPTLLSDWSDDKIVQYGRVKLDNCEIVGDSGTCDKTADKFKILPPVLSAKVRTIQSFNFKYGRIEIQAKLPSGDWVYPQIWLEPKNREYGPHYKSGRIVLGMSRGNGILAGEDKTEYGCKEMNAGCLYRQDYSLAVNRYLSKTNAEGWYENFHNYTLLWTPDALEFYVDGESIGKCQTLNSDQKHGIWWRGSSLAPFDKDFYISLGVGVGGMSEFPDKTTNGVDSGPKPWRNGEVKAVLKFFQDQDTWSKTWNDKTALRVDSIKVYAI